MHACDFRALAAPCLAFEPKGVKGVFDRRNVSQTKLYLSVHFGRTTGITTLCSDFLDSNARSSSMAFREVSDPGGRWVGFSVDRKVEGRVSRRVGRAPTKGIVFTQFLWCGLCHTQKLKS